MIALVLSFAALAQSPGTLIAPPRAKPAATATPGQTTDPGLFQRVHLAGDLALDVFSGEPTRASVIDCPTKNGPGLQLQVQDDTLMVTPMHEDQRTGSTCKLTLRTPTLAGIEVSGASKVRGGALTGLSEVKVAGAAQLDLRGIRSDAFSLKVNGAASARLSGKVDKLSLTAAGAADIDAKSLSAQSGQISSMGAGQITANVHQSADVTASGTAQITLYGQPQKLEKSVSGTGSVELK